MVAIHNPHLIAPPKPTFQRYVALNKSRYTLFRSLSYEHLKTEQFSGRVLDIGGGEKASYRPLLRLNGTYESVNFSNDIEPSITANIEEKLPIPDSQYDCVISLNTFEHIYNLDGSLSELARVLKPGGSCFIEVPFLYRVHGSPDDFNRPTHSWWAKKMRELGFAPETITIQPLAWDVFSTGFSIAERHKIPLVPYRLRRALALLPGLLCAFKIQENEIADFALGYIIRAKKS